MTDHGDGGGTLANNVMTKWDKFLPKMVLRVLLVEPDDSTRQIIALLLRKCNYKVTIVSDGLKAWELLNGKPQSIDLILTEMELPSISGFALLSLIAEHEACKNIPVIMMSAYDSVSTVYKCMLRGAADFLVKPLRKNELNNLWQHVWRRQAQSTRDHNGPREESEAQQKVEATAENNATSNRSSGYMACINLNKESIEKGTDAQSSCTKPAMDTKTSHMGIANGSLFKEAIDLIGSFDSFRKTSYKNSLNQVDHPSSMLDLSLRSHPSSPIDQISDDKHRLKQSDASAFSRYVNTTQQSLPCISNQLKNDETNSENPLSKHTIDCHQDTHSAPVGNSESQFLSPKQRMFPIPVGVRFENPGATYCSVSPPIFCIQPGHQEPSSFQDNMRHTSLPEALKVDRSATEQNENRQDFEDHSASSSFCNNSIGSGSNGHVNLVSDANNTPQLTQREAAVNRFRMKRKDRCFDKKVRYESRKKLAEQRPRVKGQFARQVQTSNISNMEAEIECGN